MTSLKLFTLMAFASGTITVQVFAQKPAPGNTEKGTTVIMLPDFLHPSMTKPGDTTLNYEYYNKNLKQISLYDIKNIDEVDHIKYYKVFYRPLPKGVHNVSAAAEYLLQCDYVHPTRDKWLKYDRVTGEITRYKIFTNQIVTTDSVTITDRATNSPQKFVYKYFKTEISGTETSQEHSH